MKYIYLIVICLLLGGIVAGCFPAKQIEMERGLAYLEKKHCDPQGGCTLTWFIEEKKIEVVTFEPDSCGAFTLGVKYVILYPR